MIALLAIAAVLLLASVWWISRPLRARRAVPVVDPRVDLETVRDRLLAQLRELDAERSDHGIDESIGRDEERRLSAELAAVLRRLDELPSAESADPAASLSRAFTVGATAVLAVTLFLVGGGLYVWQNAANLKGFALAARGGGVAASVPPMVLEMVARLEKRLAENPNDAAGWARLGRAYVVLRQMDRARDAYGRAYALAPDNVEVLSDYAWLEFSANPGNTTGPAGDLYRRLAKLQPDHPDALWFLGLAAYQSGDPRGALRIWERLARQLTPGSPERAKLEEVMQTARDEAGGRRAR